MTALIWNWYEIVEGAATGICVSVMFVLVPIVWRLEKHRKASEKRHEEIMDMHRQTHKHLGIGEK